MGEDVGRCGKMCEDIKTLEVLMGVMSNVTEKITKTQRFPRRPIGNNKNTSRPMTTTFRSDRPWVFETRFFLGFSKFYLFNWVHWPYLLYWLYLFS